MNANEKEILDPPIVDKSKQLFRDISDKFSRFSKDGFVAAKSSIGASRSAGKKAVLKMEIALRKRKMKALFSELGEAIYTKDIDNFSAAVKDPSLSGIVNGLKSFTREIDEIQEYISASSVAEPEKRVKFQDEVPEAQKSNGLSAYIEAMKDEKEEVRIGALREFFKLEGGEVIDHLISALKDRSSEVRRKAAIYLGWKMAVSAEPSLINAAKDKKPAVRRACLESLGEMGTMEAVPGLIKGLDDRDYEVRKTAYKALTKITNEFIEFDVDGSLSDRFKGIQKWEKWWQEKKK